MYKKQIIAKILMFSGGMLVFASLFNRGIKIPFLLFIIGLMLGLLGGYSYEPSKKSKNPFIVKTPRDVIKLSVIYGLLVALVIGVLNRQTQIEIVNFAIVAILFFGIFFYIGYKIKKKKHGKIKR